MIELPEALSIAGQLDRTVAGKRIARVAAGHTPHKLVWYYGDRSSYQSLLEGAVVERSSAFGGFIEISAGDANVLLGEGGSIRFHDEGEPRPCKHQLMIDFDDGSALSVAVQMYGGMGAFRKGELDNPYYLAAKEKPSPLSDHFDESHFRSIVNSPAFQKLSLKGLLATEQRVPGLGNGVLQDILFNAKMHPRRKVNALGTNGTKALFLAVKSTLAEMARLGGRDTESDLFGHPGGYRTIMSKNTANTPCPACGAPIRKEAYMGGRVYYCTKCQSL
jgi:formamidopyrimidine-DNA glycosylase